VKIPDYRIHGCFRGAVICCGGGAVKMLADELTAAGFDVKEQMECFFVPDECELEQYFEMGKRFAASLLAK
jgi:flavorubredoxin